MDSMHARVFSTLKRLATQRQRKSSLLRKTAWALHDAEALTKLVDGIVGLIESLE